MSSPFRIVFQWDAEDRVWVSHVPNFGDLSTYGETLEEALAQTRDATLGYLETAAQERLPLPADVDLLRAAIQRRPATV
jgi:predicted RNase H-like HicB family nuclease